MICKYEKFQSYILIQMIIIHDFFTQMGGGENLIVSISKKYNAKIYTLLNKSYLSNKYICEIPSFNFLKIYNKFFFLIISSFFFSIKTKETLIFSGNFAVFSIWRCKSPNKIVYHHTLPKTVFNEHYMGFDKIFFYRILKIPIIKIMKFNYLKADKIYFNSFKSKKKFLEIYPDLSHKIDLKVLYPFSSIKFNHTNNNIKRNYLVLNSRHAKEKNIFSVLDVIKDDPNVSCFLTNTGVMANVIFNKYKKYKNINFCGYLDEDKYEKLLQESLAIIVPSYDEDFGIGALDAYNLNIPLLIYKNAGFSEILDDKYDLFLDKCELPKLINTLKNNKNRNFYTNKIDLNKIFFKEFDQYK